MPGRFLAVERDEVLGPSPRPGGRLEHPARSDHSLLLPPGRPLRERLGAAALAIPASPSNTIRFTTHPVDHLWRHSCMESVLKPNLRRAAGTGAPDSGARDLDGPIHFLDPHGGNKGN